MLRATFLSCVYLSALLAQKPEPGPAVGAPAPAFSLADQNGSTHTLKSLAGPKGTMLVFYRSADW